MGDKETLILTLLELRVYTITIIISTKGIIRIYNRVRIWYYVGCGEGKVSKDFSKEGDKGREVRENFRLVLKVHSGEGVFQWKIQGNQLRRLSCPGKNKYCLEEW